MTDKKSDITACQQKGKFQQTQKCLVSWKFSKKKKKFKVKLFFGKRKKKPVYEKVLLTCEPHRLLLGKKQG